MLTKTKYKLKIKRLTAVLIVLIIILCICLTVAVCIIVRLNRNNLFSKSIMLENNYIYNRYSTSDGEQSDKSDVKKRLFVSLIKQIKQYETNYKIAAGEIEGEIDGDYSYGLYPEKYSSLDEFAVYYAEHIYESEYNNYFLKVEELFDYNFGGHTQELRHEITVLTEEYFGFTPALDELNDKENIIDVPYISQDGILPNGCEAVSATMLLRYYGFDISPTDFVDGYLQCKPIEISFGCKYGPNPRQYYAGDPYSEDMGYGCFAPCIVSALKNYLAGTDYEVINLSGNSLASLINGYTEHNIPVIVWVTVNMEKTEKILQWQSFDKKQTFLYPSNEHVAVLIGEKDGKYYFNDPYESKGTVSYDIDDCVIAYNSLGMQAVCIVKE